MALINFIDTVKSYRIFRIFYWFLKITMGLTFITSGLRKMPGVKFTQLPVDNPVGLFFEGMYETGFYWNFIGYFQIVAGIILMTPWLKRLSPLLIFPVTLNIFLVSVSLNMKGTPLITAMMVLANLYLILWHLRSYTPLFKLKGS
ncbi:MAG: hypothetical protein KJO05_00260 [Bacteroidia bacterium]|nr:hypothetical protein [Bacteroidia bacterium]MBT8275429.1 hypothetical protein [Bacteroidia bacterium]NNF30865.1 hypothetical protein [Flavobacteriaceae bacterium]NNJ81940.1 hypothetical protein [Flavobacteriaceae bacterium]NNM08050.1 hypothetical protein [Flavobacteriaceae bacterium]